MSDTRAAARRTVAAEPVPSRPRWRRWVLVFLAAVVLELLVLGVWAGMQAREARDELLAARRDAQRGRAAALELDIPAAREAFASASAGFASGRDRLSGPVVRWLDYMPAVGDDLVATRGLAEGGVLVADAALGLVAAVDDLPGGLDAFAPRDGRLPTAAVEALREPAASALGLLDRASAVAGSMHPEDLAAPVADAHAEFLEQVAEARELVGAAHSVSATLPGLLGAGEPRRYLLAAQNPAELRGTGGFLGAYAVVEIDDGQLSFGDFFPVQDLTSVHHSAVEPPNPDYADRYNRFGGAGFWQAINATPDFPSAATAIERLWARTEGSTVDGVIAVDPLAYEELLRLSGPVEVPRFGSVGADEVVEVVANEAYGAFEQDERKQVLGAIAAGALQRTLAGDGVDPLQAARTLLAVARDGHLMMHSAHPEEQALLRDYGLAGELLQTPGDYLSVVANSASFTKLDYYIDRSIDYDVELHADGSADGRVRVAFANSAPTEGLPRHVVGPGARGTLEAGEQRSWVSIFCAVGCQPAADGQWTAGEELGHGVVSRFVNVKSGGTVVLEARWHVPDAWDPDAGAYTLTYQGQPTLRRTTLDVRVHAPDGYAIENGGEWSGRPEGTRQFTVPVHAASSN